MTTYEVAVARAKAKLCRECGRKLGARAIFLFLVPGDFRVSVCGPRCLERYSDGPEREPDPPRPPEPAAYQSTTPVQDVQGDGPDPEPPQKKFGIEDLL